MLEQLALENVGVIRSAQVDFAPGLTAITGETGAGKTMLLTGLNLLMGGKADRDVIRSGETRAAVEGSWLLPPSPVASNAAVRDAVVRPSGVDDALATPDARAVAALRIVAEAGGEQDSDGTVIAARVLSGSRSKAHLGGRTVPQNVLAQFSSELVTVHGQADQSRLRTPRKQREALDAYAGPAHLKRVARYQRYRRARDADQAEHDALVRDRTTRRQEAELLRHGLAEIEQVAPLPGEAELLDAQIARLTNVEALRAAAGLAHQFLGGAAELGEARAAVDQVAAAGQALGAVAEQDPLLADLVARLAEAGYLLADVAAELARYLADLEADPLALEAAHQRRAQLHALTRSYGDVRAWQQQAERRLAEVSDDDDRIEHLAQSIAELDTRLAAAASELSATRRAAAERLAAAVTVELHGLAMPEATLHVQVSETELGPTGADEVAFLLTPHRGATAQPLAKGASGGELSRVMLAVEVALAAGGDGLAAPNGDLPTFVFDEIDAGVGGAAATEVGRRLARLAKATQVVVVTHMPQVAAFADQHLVVTKSTSADRTETAVAAVSGDDRVRELARMLSGKADSEVARQHAAELLAESRG